MLVASEQRGPEAQEQTKFTGAAGGVSRGDDKRGEETLEG